VCKAHAECAVSRGSEGSIVVWRWFVTSNALRADHVSFNYCHSFALCVFIVVTFLVVMVDRAELVENGHGLANQ